MPLRHRKITVPPPGADVLRRRLVEEWEHPTENPSAPIIIEEDGEGQRPTRLFVVWDEWPELDQEERSEIIMDAYEEVRGRDKSLLVTVAMGLTRREADRMHIVYE